MSRVRRLAPRPGAALFTRLLGALLSTVALSLGVISLLFVLGLVAPDRAAASEADESGESVRGQRGGRVVHDANQDVGDGSCSAADAAELIAWFGDDIETPEVVAERSRLWFAGDAVRAFVLTGNADKTAGWLQMLRSNAARLDEAHGALTELVPVVRLAGRQLQHRSHGVPLHR